MRIADLLFARKANKRIMKLSKLLQKDPTNRDPCLILAWIVGVHSAAVRIAADRYAPYLLEAALDLET